jgi:hypothetical protein
LGGTNNAEAELGPNLVQRPSGKMAAGRGDLIWPILDRHADGKSTAAEAREAAKIRIALNTVK